MAKKWIAGAVKHGKGKFSAKAKEAGESTREYAAQEKDAPGKLGKEARLAETLMSMHHGGDKPARRASTMYTHPRSAR